MECEEGPSSSAQSKASRSARRCPGPITSFLGGRVARISRMKGPLPRLGITIDDQEGPEDAVEPDQDKTEDRGSVTPGGLRFGVETCSEEHKESDSSDTPNMQVMNSDPDIGNCRRTLERTVGRDTMGFDFFVSDISRCPEGRTCYEECGYGTNCDAQCKVEHGVQLESARVSEMVPGFGQTGIGAGPGGVLPLHSDFQRSFAAPGGPGGYPGGPARPGGSGVYSVRPGGYTGVHPDGRYRPCPAASQQSGTGQLNFYIMLLLEAFGVLIFFAICTITFWLTLGYHVVRLLVELKNADRNVQVAVAIVFGLLILAFAICHATSGRGSCCRASDRSRGHSSRAGSCGHHKSKSTTKNTSTIAMILNQIKKAFSFGGGSKRRRSSSCGAKKPSAPSRRKTRYSDCEGRAIFTSSRRYAIPTEMKQPPTIFLWLLDVLGRFMS